MSLYHKQSLIPTATATAKIESEGKQMNEIFDSLIENMDADTTEKILQVKTMIDDKTTEVESLTNKIAELENTIAVKSAEITKYEGIIAKYIKTETNNNQSAVNDVIDYDSQL